MFFDAGATELPYLHVTIKLVLSVIAGGLIGMERSFHGRPTGFRTHSLICLACAASVQLVTHLPVWMAGAPEDFFRTDATRIMQAIIQGLGFLGAGVIFREGLTIRGLTTSASIWITAPIGLLFGVGFFYVGAICTVATIIILTLFRKIEGAIHTRTYAHCMVSFARDSDIHESDVRKLLGEHNVEVVGGVNYEVNSSGNTCICNMTVRAAKPEYYTNLSRDMRRLPDYSAYSIEFIRD